MKLFLFAMNGFFLTTRTVFLDFHPIGMGFFVFRHRVVFFFAFATLERKLNSHSEASIRTVLFYLETVKKSRKKCFEKRTSYFLGGNGKKTEVRRL